MRRRAAPAALAPLALAWGGCEPCLRARRAPRPPGPVSEMRGAWHVHTTRSDGRGSLDELVRSARDAGIHFVVDAVQDQAWWRAAPAIARPSGDGQADVERVRRALLDGSAWPVEGRRDGAPWLFTNPAWIE